jgi:hypothetical protein
MAKSYRVTPIVRAVNKVTGAFIRRGRGPEFTYVLTVVGRRSGVARSTLVDVMADGGQRWLVAPYGETNWVWNARAAGVATLSRDGRDEQVRLVELSPEERVPILRMYLRQVRIVRSYFDVTAGSPDDQLLAVAPAHPVFRIEPLASDELAVEKPEGSRA